MSAPTGGEMNLSKEEVLERVRGLPMEKDNNDGPTLGESDRKIQSVIDTGGETEYARIYLAFVTGTYNGNRMLWQRYVWLSKPGAYESDMWGSNGMSMRLSEGMESSLVKATLATKAGLDGDATERFVYAPDEA